MMDFKLLSGKIIKTLYHGNYRMTLEVLENNLLFVEVKHTEGNVSSSMSEIIEFEYRFSKYVEYGDDMLRYYSVQPLPVRTILSDTIFSMRHV
jgi:hypothetical protein